MIHTSNFRVKWPADGKHHLLKAQLARPGSPLVVEPLIIISTYLRDSVEQCSVGGEALTHHSDVSSSLLPPLSLSTGLEPEQLLQTATADNCDHFGDCGDLCKLAHINQSLLPGLPMSDFRAVRFRGSSDIIISCPSISNFTMDKSPNFRSTLRIQHNILTDCVKVQVTSRRQEEGPSRCLLELL